MKGWKGSATVEMAYIMPVVLMVFTAIVYMTFYFHDKNIIQGTAYETAVIVSQRARTEEEVSGEEVFMERLGRKLVFFSSVVTIVESDEKEIVVKAEASRLGMKIETRQKMKIVEAEKNIRDIRRVKKMF